MNNDYSLEFLEKTFNEHSIIQQQKINIDKERYPDSEYSKKSFNLSLALHVIVKEIIKLKKKGPNFKYDNPNVSDIYL